MPPGKKTAPKKKTTAKKEESDKLSVSEVVELLLDGSRRWGTGRDRDTNLENEGYDLDELRRAISIARGKRLSNG